MAFGYRSRGDFEVIYNRIVEVPVADVAVRLGPRIQVGQRETDLKPMWVKKGDAKTK